MNILSCLLIVLILLASGAIYGGMWMRACNIKNTGLFAETGIGVILSIFDFCVIELIGGWFGLSLLMCGYIWLCLILGLGIVGIIKYDLLKRLGSNADKAGKNINGNAGAILLTASVLLLIVAQITGVCMFAYNQPNALRQIALATRAYDGNVLAEGSPMMMLWAFMARLLNIHPMIVIFTVSEFVMIPVYYAIWWKISEELFEDRMLQLIMLLCISILNIWGYTSEHAIGTTLLFSWFSGTAYIVYGLLPTVLWLLLNKRSVLIKLFEGYRNKNDNKSYDDIDDYYKWEEEDMKNHRIINARTVAIALLVVVLLLIGSVYIMNRKINSLYTTTVNLQNQVNDGCSVYEFTPANGEQSEGYLVRQSDGSLVMVGGGAEDNGSSLYDFIAEYGTNISVWYLYASDKENSGAYDYCKRMGISVDKVYVLNVEEVE